MFTFKLDVLLISLQRAAAAIIDNRKPGPPPADIDPREVQRMRDELRRAREDVRLQVTRGRMLW